MGRIRFEKLTIKEEEKARAGVRIRDRFLGELCGTPDTPGSGCSVPTPRPRGCRSKAHISLRYIIKM